MLGPIDVVGADGAPVAPRSARQRLLLAVLAARAGRLVTADELVEALWGDGLPSQPLASLQSQVFRLRRHIGALATFVETHPSGYRLAAEPDRIDAGRFEGLLAAAARGEAEPSAALQLIDGALQLWRGRAYLEVADHDALRAEATRLEELKAKANERRAELLLHLGRAADAVAASEALAAEHPFREGAVALLMQALAASGRTAEALGAFHAFRVRLRDELGLEPSAGLRAVEQDVLAPTRPARRIGLPGNSFVGREAAVEEAAGRLAQGRLVTLTGPGGIGKTRLAVHVAAAVADRYPDGVHLCELAGVTDADTVAIAVASALRVESARGRRATDRIAEVLQAKRALLVLDNCEHVRGAVAALAETLINHAPDVDLLATSRQRLGVTGEQLQFVGPLRVGAGGTDDPASTLFVDRARAVRPGFAPSPADEADIAELCSHLGGMPLAIELAAARAIARTPAEILVEVRDRLDDLGDERRPTDRHRSMDAVVGWSYDLLNPGEQHVFARLAVFAGGCTAEAAAAVAGAPLDECVDALAALVEQTLVAADEVAGRTRFTMLEPVRQHAERRLERTGGTTEARRRHARWFAGWLPRAEAGLRGADEVRWARQVDAELANLRIAHAWCLAHDPPAAAELAGALFWYATWYAPSEVFGWAEATISRFGFGGFPSLPGAFATAALGAWRHGELDRARQLAQRAIEQAKDPRDGRFAWEALGSGERLAGNLGRAAECHEITAELARAAGDACHEATAHTRRALTLGYWGRPDEARAALATATELLGGDGNPTARAFCDYVAGEIEVEAAPEVALVLLRRSRDAARRIGNRFLAAIAGVSAVSCAARLGDAAEALSGYAEVIDHFHRAGAWPQQWTTIRTLIETLTRLQRDEPAAVLAGALEASTTAPAAWGPDASRLADAIGVLGTRLGAERLGRLQAQGAGMGDDRAVAFALECVRSFR